jgi:hypothetical protein
VLHAKDEYKNATADAQQKQEDDVLEDVHRKYAAKAEDVMRQHAGIVAEATRRAGSAITSGDEQEEEDEMEAAGKMVYEMLIQRWCEEGLDEEVCVPSYDH